MTQTYVVTFSTEKTRIITGVCTRLEAAQSIAEHRYNDGKLEWQSAFRMEDGDVRQWTADASTKEHRRFWIVEKHDLVMHSTFDAISLIPKPKPPEADVLLKLRADFDSLRAAFVTSEVAKVQMAVGEDVKRQLHERLREYEAAKTYAEEELSKERSDGQLKYLNTYAFAVKYALDVAEGRSDFMRDAESVLGTNKKWLDAAAHKETSLKLNEALLKLRGEK